MGENKRIILLIAIMTLIAAAASGSAIAILYNTAFEEERARLVEIAQSQARMIEAVAKFNRRSHPPGEGWAAEAATLGQIKEAHGNYEGFGKTGEFTLARRAGGEIHFILSHRHDDLDRPRPVSMDFELAEPMRRALTGKSGWVVGLDYRGKQVLAAHEPVTILNLGIVAKIDLDEIRKPFWTARNVVIVITLFLVGLGAFLFSRITTPMVSTILQSGGRLQDFAAATDRFWETDREFRSGNHCAKTSRPASLSGIFATRRKTKREKLGISGFRGRLFSTRTADTRATAEPPPTRRNGSPGVSPSTVCRTANTKPNWRTAAGCKSTTSALRTAAFWSSITT